MSALAPSPRSAALDTVVARFETVRRRPRRRRRARRDRATPSRGARPLPRRRASRRRATRTGSTRASPRSRGTRSRSRRAARPPRPCASLVESVRLRLHGGPSYVFVDGRFAPELSSSPLPPSAGLTAGSLAGRAARDAGPRRAAPRDGGRRPRRSLDLSTLLFEDGFFLHLSPTTCLPVPIELIHVATTAESAALPPRARRGRRRRRARRSSSSTWRRPASPTRRSP